MHNVQGMEVCGEADLEKRLLINGDKQPAYSSLVNPYDSPSNIYHKYGKQECDEQKDWLRYSAKVLSPDLKKRIVIDFMRLHLGQQNMSNSKLDPLIAFKFLCHVQNMCPLRIGNKEFHFKDLIVLKKEQQEKLFEIGNPNQCWAFLSGLDNRMFEMGLCCETGNHRVRILKKQPYHIKENLVIKRSYCCEPILHRSCLISGGAGIALMTIALISACPCPCLAPAPPMPFDPVLLLCTIGGGFLAPSSIWALIARASLCYECCVGQYSVDQDKYL